MSETWTISKILTWTRQFFTEKGIDSARLDAELLLAEVLQKDRLYLYTHYDQPLNQTERDTYRAMVQRRAKREPVSQILGEREFFGRPFLVTRDVLTPRPETEHVVETALEFAAKLEKPPRILDVGTGTGCIVISLLAQLPEARGVAVDLSPKALAIATQNATKNNVQDRLTLLESDLFSRVSKSDTFDIIVTNPPYIPETDKPTLMPEVAHYEPPMALFGGPDGLDVIRRLVQDARGFLGQPGLFAMEIGAGQFAQVAALLTQAGFSNVRAVKDLAGHERVAVGER